MALFKRKRKDTINENVRVSDVYVITSVIVSSYNDGTGAGPMCVTMYFLAKCDAKEYYELFSGKKFEYEEKLEDGTSSVGFFDTPYITKVEPLSEYLTNPDRVTIDIQLLFDFITHMNVLERVETFSDKTSEEDVKSSQ